MVKIFIDGATLDQVAELNDKVDGFTTNPSLIRKLGIGDYTNFAKEVLKLTDKPVVFEVLSDDFRIMEFQAHTIASWGRNVNVKVPITDSHGRTSLQLITNLINDKININVTAVTTITQVNQLLPVFEKAERGYLSVFAGRIADTGRDPVPIMEKVLYLLEGTQIKLIWASAREIFNAVQADMINCDIITLNIDLYRKYQNIGKDLTQVSLETVQMFVNDAKNYTL